MTDGARFHLFISSPPCGDSRLFTVSSNAGEANTGVRDDNPNRASRGQLRVKIEAGQGAFASVTHLMIYKVNLQKPDYL